MLASHPHADSGGVDRLFVSGASLGKPYGLKRIGQAYGISVLAAVLGLPGLAAGLITSNNCTLNGEDCPERMAYGVIAGIVLAVVVQLLLALHFRLGWLFWCASTAITVATVVHLDQWPVLLAGVLLAPGLASWASDPPNRRSGVIAHWAPRLSVLMAVLGVLVLTGLLLPV